MDKVEKSLIKEGIRVQGMSILRLKNENGTTDIL